MLLRASDGAVGVEAEHQFELCPNDDSEMRALTWKQQAEEYEQSAMRFFKEREMLIYWLLRAYQSGHREGWEQGPSTDETMDGICSVLANLHYDPNLSEDAKQLLKQDPIYAIEVTSETAH
jgi:hypothetical protein